ncbi:hypothetical protein Tco_0986984 [Tanacetum coccineum]
MLESASNKLLSSFHDEDSMIMLAQRQQTRNDGIDDKDNDKAQSSSIAKHDRNKLKTIEQEKDQDHLSLIDKSNIIDLHKECHQNERPLPGEIVSLKHIESN